MAFVVALCYVVRETRQLRVIDVLLEHVEGVVDPTAEVILMQALCETFPPAEVQQVGDILLQTLQLRNTNRSGLDAYQGNVFSLI